MKQETRLRVLVSLQTRLTTGEEGVHSTLGGLGPYWLPGSVKVVKPFKAPVRQRNEKKRRSSRFHNKLSQYEEGQVGGQRSKVKGQMFLSVTSEFYRQP